ncbi:hypothetical protein GCM10011344_27510 [Dokdonia pacifica]|uniref:Uncharacterized protein n=1 Tax=Dokdonia pacifica TaxID=1627892 RepID=A0A239CES3_9FLAO|nr:hypothetical protein [Dokdonia pacifica]GGG25328.1 hypothetical protein GCM10011344_27510 [Dokdonia pacifica]SNS18736.1 hypothetical protein SAMN06265376_107294 [Dokdonia pacifica]
MNKEKLFQVAFEKAQNQSGSEKPNGIVKYLSNKLLELGMNGYGASDRTLLRCFNKYIDGKKEPVSPKTELLNAVSQYIGFDSYEDFVIKNNVQINDDSTMEMVTRIVNQNGEKSIYLENNSAPINIS